MDNNQAIDNIAEYWMSMGHDAQEFKESVDRIHLKLVAWEQEPETLDAPMWACTESVPVPVAECDSLFDYPQDPCAQEEPVDRTSEFLATRSLEVNPCNHVEVRQPATYRPPTPTSRLSWATTITAATPTPRFIVDRESW